MESGALDFRLPCYILVAAIQFVWDRHLLLLHTVEVTLRSILIPKEGVLEKPFQGRKIKSSGLVTLICSEK